MLLEKTSGSLRIHRFQKIDSTNSEAIRRAQAGEREGAVIVADSQTKGRGREGRRWESPAGKNLYVSFLMRPRLRPVEALGITQIAAGVVKKVLEKIPPCPPLLKGGAREIPPFEKGGLGGIFTIKKPNDILLNGKKIAGILTEMSSRGEETLWVVCGIGINVNCEETDFSPEVRETATSLKIVFGREFDREEILERLMKEVHGKIISNRRW